MVPWNKRVTLNQNSDLENKTSIIKQNGGLETGRCPRNKMMVLKQEGVQKTKWWSWNRKVSKKQNGDLKKENKNLNVDHETKYFIYSIQSEQRTATEFLLENMKLKWPWNKIETLKQKKWRGYNLKSSISFFFDIGQGSWSFSIFSSWKSPRPGIWTNLFTEISWLRTNPVNSNEPEKHILKNMKELVYISTLCLTDAMETDRKRIRPNYRVVFTTCAFTELKCPL